MQCSNRGYTNHAMQSKQEAGNHRIKTIKHQQQIKHQNREQQRYAPSILRPTLDAGYQASNEHGRFK